MTSIKLTKTIEPTETDKAFLAGIIEADGCISLVFGSNNYYHPRIQIANQSVLLLEWIGTHWSGAYNPNHNKSKCLTLHWSRCDEIKGILLDVLPYLVSKRREGELLLEYAQANKGQGIPSTMSRERMTEISSEITFMHNGGRP